MPVDHGGRPVVVVARVAVDVRAFYKALIARDHRLDPRHGLVKLCRLRRDVRRVDDLRRVVRERGIVARIELRVPRGAGRKARVRRVIPGRLRLRRRFRRGVVAPLFRSGSALRLPVLRCGRSRVGGHVFAARGAAGQQGRKQKDAQKQCKNSMLFHVGVPLSFVCLSIQTKNLRKRCRKSEIFFQNFQLHRG